jgi:hypothetical protein
MKSRLFLRSALGVGILVVAFSAASSALAGGQANVRGTVSHRNKPLRSVWVIVSQNGAEKGRSLTGSDGSYYIGGLDGGGYRITVAGTRWEADIRLPDNSSFDIKIP